VRDNERLFTSWLLFLTCFLCVYGGTAQKENQCPKDGSSAWHEVAPFVRYLMQSTALMMARHTCPHNEA
ncbi:MAG: hypothetical protein KBE09_05410, partial [Candidatus Pacebacteria bacterium]|nr:hypothetical protein [Candidatus Paceibacterota bacterium]